METRPRYQFADFDVSQRERQVRRRGAVLPLIPRYFDLLVLLIERRPSVVTRREIFDRVWGDVIVSDGALSQAVRTLRRTLGDDTREPRFIRTVSRHGYSFVFADVREDAGDAFPVVADREPPLSAPGDINAAAPAAGARIDRLVADLVAARTSTVRSLEEQRDLAQQLHTLGTARALEALARHPGHALALALMRETRWDVPGAGAVPLWGQPEGLAAARVLVWLRAREVLAVIRRRWAQAAGGGGVAGLTGGALGGALLWLAPTSSARPTAIVVLGVLGALAGFTAAAGVAGGMTTAEAVARSRRGLAIVMGGAAGGMATGLLVG
ncbi:MAG: transcriptional regulator, partial [Acidobacteriota bacterium]|nr:transcriptional regulator [Acidobacteriota bacterium]